MRLVLLEYLRMLRESREFDVLLPDLLLAMGIIPISKSQVGVRQAGVDLAAVGNDDSGQRYLWLFVLKRGDLGRRDWDTTPQAVRQSLDEIKDVYLRNNVAPEHSNLPVKVVVATTGDFKQEIEQQYVGYADSNKQPGRSYSFWNGDRIAELMEQYLLSEYALPALARSDLRRALALVGEPDYELEHFFALLRLLLKWDREDGAGCKPNADIVRSVNTIGISLGILCRWAAESGNLKNAVIACERTLLWTFDAVRRHNLVEEKQVTESYVRLVAIYLDISAEYFNKIAPHLHTDDALLSYNRHAILLNERLFEEIGLVATIGLSHLLWGIGSKDEALVDGAMHVADGLVALLKSHAASGSPYYDGHSIDIALALSLLFMTKKHEPAKEWLIELGARLHFAFTSKRFFPISTDSFDDLVDLQYDRENEDLARLTETSWMIPVLAQWAAVLQENTAYELLAGQLPALLPGTTFQLWHPDAQTDSHLYKGRAHHETGTAEAPVQFSPTVEEMVQSMRKLRTESLLKDQGSSSATRAGIPWLDFVACRHFRTPVNPAFWQALALEG